MRDRERAEELLSQAWQHRPTYPLERVEMLLSALAHAVLASSEAADRRREDSPELVDGAWPHPAVLRANDSGR